MPIKRRFIPGEEWLYLKIYTGPDMVESLLVKEVYDVVYELALSGYIDNFFFVRYSDVEGNHLRIRFHLTDCGHISHIIAMVSDSFSFFVDKRLVHKIVYDTYIRELERYGADIIDDVETIFGISSWLIIDQLRKNALEKLDDDRWIWGAGIMDRVLSSFNFDYKGKQVIYDAYFNAYKGEVGYSKKTKDLLTQKVQQYSREIRAAVEANQKANGLMDLQTPFLKSSRIQQAIQRLNEIIRAEDRKLSLNAANMLNGIIHMHFNRLFIAQQRSGEFVIYHILSKTYKSLDVMKNLGIAAHHQ